MVRKIIKIDEEKCSGCAACADACHEGAIEMVDGKARLTRENFCDGLGDCLPECPTGAITFEEREAPAYDEAAVAAAKSAGGDKSACACGHDHAHRGHGHGSDHGHHGHAHPHGAGCPGARPQILSRDDVPAANAQTPSQLAQWPCQIKLVPVRAPYFDGAKLLIAADCTAYAYANFHADYMRGKVTLIGCPKLDAEDYSEKLSEILLHNDIKSVTVLRMEVPCCGGIEMAAKRALQNSGKFIPWRVVTVSINGEILDD